jgi:hypothetical protein
MAGHQINQCMTDGCLEQSAKWMHNCLEHCSKEDLFDRIKTLSGWLDRECGRITELKKQIPPPVFKKKINSEILKSVPADYVQIDMVMDGHQLFIIKD